MLLHFLELVKPLLPGAKVTIEITILSTILAFIMAFIGGFGRLSKYRLIRSMSVVYVEVFRGTSLVVQLFWLYYALPILGLKLPALAAGVLALGLNYGAYGSEVVRSSILSVPKGQTEAAIALNMTPTLRMRSVILPQAFMMMLPSFGNLQIELLKGTALISLITMADLTFQAMLLNSSTLRPTEIFTILLLMYFIIAMPLVSGIKRLERRFTVGRS